MYKKTAWYLFFLLSFIAPALQAAPAATPPSEQERLLDELATSISPSHELLTRVLASLSAKQKAELASLFPGTTLTPELLGKVYATVYNDKLSLDERGTQLQALMGVKPGQFVKRTVCIWDPIGKSGPIFQAAMDQKARAQTFGIDLNMVPYTDETIATVDLKAGRCDAALISGLRARTLNRFTGTVDAIGGITSEKEMRTLLYVLSRPAMAPKMVQGPFVTLGIAQGGAAFVFVNDKSINTLGKAAGKKVAVLDYDPVQAEMVAQIGATPVPATMISAPNMFNNHVVDVLAAPLVAYNALELYKGMSPKGGIINFPLAQISIQLIGWQTRFPNVVGQLIREAFFENYDKISVALNSEVKDIPKHWWIDIPAKDKGEYETLMQQARLTLRGKNYYSSDMLTLERKIRCKSDPARGECTNPVE